PRPPPIRGLARRDAVNRGGDLPDVLRRGSATAAHEIDKPVACELAEETARVLGSLVVQSELVRQTGIRITRDPGRRDLGEILDEGTHLGGAEGAVDADQQRIRVL